MAILLKNISKPVMDLIYDKQNTIQKRKGKSVSLEKTVEILLKDAYLKDKAPALPVCVNKSIT